MPGSKRGKGRPRKFPVCPICGKGALRVLWTKKRGWCLNRACRCECCGERLRYVSADGLGGRWFRVRGGGNNRPYH